MRETAIRRLLFAVVMVALGFGARQALASPGPIFGPGGSCSEQTCDYWCVTQMGANYGFCLNGTCTCRSGP